MRETVRSWIDSIFSPFHSFLDMAIDRLRDIALITAQGLNIGQYLTIFGDMPRVWQVVIVSLLASATLLGGLLIFRSIMRVYYGMKEGVKWW